MPFISAVAYARFSSDKQQESSITVQLAAIRKFCASHNIQLIREYVDEAQTGTNANRKQFQQMIKDAASKEFKFVIVHRMDRWARNVDDARHYKKVLARYGIKMVSALEEFDETPEGEFFELVSMGMAELYSKKLAREAAAGKIANAKLGKAHGGTPLLGYKVKNKRYVIEEKEAEAVKIIFAMAADGYGYTQIRDYLNAHGYRHADGRLFTAHFYDILRNKKYIGEYIYNRASAKDEFGQRNNHRNKPAKDIIRVPDAMPRLVDEKTFYKVQSILDARKNGTAPPLGKPNRKYLLSGLLRCKECGRAICGASAFTAGLRYPIYRCGAKGRTCPTRVINADYLEDYTHSLLYECLFAPENEERLKLLTETCYIKAFDGLQKKRQQICADMLEAENIVKEYGRQMAQDDSKHIFEYFSEGIEELSAQIRELEFAYKSINEEILHFPDFKPALIRRNAKRFASLLKAGEFKSTQQAFNALISVIHIDSETVETTLKLNALLDSYQPINATIIEDRDNIARPENHYKRALVFSTLSVRI